MRIKIIVMSALPSSIRRIDGKLEIVDQLLLPHVTEYVQIRNIFDAHDAIKSMKVVCFSNHS